MSVVVSLTLCLSLTAALQQPHPDFSGKWTRIPAAAGAPVETLTITQTPDTLTVNDNGRRWVHKLDGSESRNLTTLESPPPESIQSSTSSWEGDTLVTRFPVKSSREGPYVLRVAMSLEGKTLVVRATSVSDTSKAVLREETKRYSK